MAGHSHWANIKHKKARVDAVRGKVWSKCARAIIVAARHGGGDPDANLTLRYAIDEARSVNMPKDTINNAIKKGTGELGGENYEAVIYEGYGPNGVAIMIETLTDNKNRTVPEFKKIFDKNGGNLGTSGCVAYIFTARGVIVIPKSQADEERMMDLALEAGAEDVAEDGEMWEVHTDIPRFMQVREALEKEGLKPERAEITKIPNTTVECRGTDAQRVLALMEAFEDHEDVQKVHANFDIPDDELAALGS